MTDQLIIKIITCMDTAIRVGVGFQLRTQDAAAIVEHINGLEAEIAELEEELLYREVEIDELAEQLEAFT